MFVLYLEFTIYLQNKTKENLNIMTLQLSTHEYSYGKETITQTFECIDLPNGLTANITIEAVLHTSREDWGKETELYDWQIEDLAVFNDCGNELETSKEVLKKDLYNLIDIEL